MTATAKKGQHIVVDSHAVGEVPRQGDVLEVIERDSGTSFRVRWDDGHESMFQPIAGTLHTVDKKDAAKHANA